MRAAVNQGSFTTLRADGAGGTLLFAGILLLIPRFISDLLALFLLAAQVWRAAGTALGTRMATARDGDVVDLTPEQCPIAQCLIGAETNGSIERQ